MRWRRGARCLQLVQCVPVGMGETGHLFHSTELNQKETIYTCMMHKIAECSM